MRKIATLLVLVGVVTLAPHGFTLENREFTSPGETRADSNQFRGMCLLTCNVLDRL